MQGASMLGLGIYTTEEINTIDVDSFSSEISMLDYTSAIISVNGLTYEYMQHPGLFQGLCCLNNDDKSAQLISDMKRRKGEIIELLKQGNNIFVILPGEQNIYVRTGKKYSGTGKNRQTTNIVDIFNLLSFLPIEIECIKATGTKINFVESKEFYILKSNMKNDFQYRSYITKCEGVSLMRIANTTKDVGMVVEYEKGKIILLPTFAQEELYETEEEWYQAIDRSIQALIQLDVELKSNINKYILPEWTKNFLVPKEKEAIEQLDSYEKELEVLNNKIEQQKVNIKDLQKIKMAFTATGEILESICKEMFLYLGFKEMPTEHNRSDLVLKYEERDVVVEVKGLRKSAGEKNAAQLEKWVSEHIENYGKQPKAILLVNAHREVQLDKRTEDVFPKQMLKYAISREQCLLSTIQLICLYLDCINNPSRKKQKINKLLETNGIYNGYENVNEYLAILK